MAKKDKEELKKKKSKKTEDVKKSSKSKESKSEKPEPKKTKKGEWDESTAQGGDFFKLPQGETECLLRVRSVISVGQCVFEFKGKKDSKATSGIGLVIEAWPYKVKKDKIKLTSDKPAIIYHTFKALKGNKDSHWSKMLKDLDCSTPADLSDNVGIGTIFTSDKGYMYLRQRVFKTGLAERKACPKLTQKGYLIPNLNEMTEKALRELNPLTQVADYVTKAINYPDSTAQELVDKIRKDKPEFGKKQEPKGKSGKKDKKKKKKLSESKEY